MHTDLSLEEALAALVEACPTLPVEEEPTGQVAGRPLAADAVSRWPLPPFDQALCVGYALRAADLHRANHKRPAFLRVLGHVRAGQTAGIPVAAGQAVKVDAGAPIPPGCDCVVPLADTDGGEETLSVFCQLWPFDNIRQQGSLVPAGTVLCPARTRPDAALTALLRAAGVATVRARPGAPVAVLTVGDELTGDFVSPLPPAQVVDFNLLYLTECWGGQVDSAMGRHSATRPEDLLEAFKELLAGEFPLILVAGGQDAAFSVLTQMGAQPVLRGIQLRRGERVAAFRYRDSMLLLLPGEPLFAGVFARVLVPALLAALGEDTSLLPQRKKVVLINAPARARPQRQLLPAMLQGERAALLEPEKESLLCLHRMQALVSIPAGARPGPGDLVTALVL